MLLNLAILKEKYPQFPKVEIDEAQLKVYLESLHITRSERAPSTEDLQSEQYQNQINVLINLLLGFGFNPEKAEILRSRFTGTSQAMNAYFTNPPGVPHSIALPLAGHIKSKMEEAVYQLNQMALPLRAPALAQVTQDAYACADGTLENLESLVRNLAGGWSHIDYFIGEAKRKVIEATLQEEYRKGTFNYISRNAGQEIHVVPSLVNTLSAEFGLEYKSKERHPYIVESLPQETAQLVRDFSDRQLAQSLDDESFLEVMALDIQSKLPVEPTPDASDDERLIFSEQLQQFLENLGIGELDDLACTAEINIEFEGELYPRTVATHYKPCLDLSLHDILRVYLVMGYEITLAKLISEIQRAYQAKDFNQMFAVMAGEIGQNYQVFGEIIQALATTQNSHASIKALLREPVKQKRQILQASDSEEAFIKAKRLICKEGYTEDGICNIPDNGLWVTILNRNLKINWQGFTDPLKYAIERKLRIGEVHFLAHFHQNKLKLRGEPAIDYLAKYTGEPERKFLHGSLSEVGLTFNAVADPEVLKFLEEIGVSEASINPGYKLTKLLTEVQSAEDLSAKMPRIGELLAQTTTLADLSVVINVSYINKIPSLREQSLARLRTIKATRMAAYLLSDFFKYSRSSQVLESLMNFEYFRIDELLSELVCLNDLNKHSIQGFFLYEAGLLGQFLQKFQNSPALREKIRPLFLNWAILANKPDHLNVLVDLFGVDLLPSEAAPVLKLLYNPKISSAMKAVLDRLSEARLKELILPQSLKLVLEKVTCPVLLAKLFGNLTADHWTSLYENPANQQTFSWLLTPIEGLENPALTRLKAVGQIPADYFRRLQASELRLHRLIKGTEPSFEETLDFYSRTGSLEEIKNLQKYFLSFDIRQQLAKDFTAEQLKTLNRLIFGARELFLIKPALSKLNCETIQDEELLKKIMKIAEAVSESYLMNLLRLYPVFSNTATKDKIFYTATGYFKTLPEGSVKIQNAGLMVETFCLTVPADSHRHINRILFGHRPQYDHEGFYKNLDKAYIQFLSSVAEELYHEALIRLTDPRFSSDELVKQYLEVLLPKRPVAIFLADSLTILQCVLRRKSVDLLKVLFEQLPRATIHELVPKQMRKESRALTQQYEAIRRKCGIQDDTSDLSTVVYAKYCDFPESIPLMFMALYETNWKTRVSVGVVKFLKDPMLTVDDHRILLQALQVKDPVASKYLKEIYESLSPQIKAVWQGFQPQAQSPATGSMHIIQKRLQEEEQPTNNKKYKQTKDTQLS